MVVRSYTCQYVPIAVRSGRSGRYLDVATLKYSPCYNTQRYITEEEGMSQGESSNAPDSNAARKRKVCK